jgi:hypothetical protein
MTMIVGLYDTGESAGNAVDDLIEAGFGRSGISLLLPDEDSAQLPSTLLDAPAYRDEGPHDTEVHATIDCGDAHPQSVWVTGPLATAMHGSAKAIAGPVLDALVSVGIGQMAAANVVDAVCAGAVLVAVTCEEKRVREARDILDGHAPINPRWQQRQNASSRANASGQHPAKASVA